MHPNVKDIDLIRQKGTLRGTSANGCGTHVLDPFDKSTTRESKGEASVCTGTTVTAVDAAAVLHSIFEEIESLAYDNIDLLQHALHSARSSKGKILDILVQEGGKTNHLILQSCFRPNPRDNSLKRIPRILEKANRWK